MIAGPVSYLNCTEVRLRRLLSVAVSFSVLLTLGACADSPGTCTVTKVGETAVTLRGPYVTTEARINGNSASMVVDTGAQVSAVTGAAITALGLLADPHHGTELAGVGGSGLGQNDALIGSITVAGADTGSTHAPVMESVLASPDGKPLDGIAGADILAKYDVDLDIPGNRLALYRVRHCSGRFLPWQMPYTAIPAEVGSSDRMSIPVGIDGHTVRAIIDSGSNRTLVDLDTARRLGVPRDALLAADSRPGWGAAGVGFRLTPYRFTAVQVGDITLDHPRLMVLDRPLKEADMLIGLDFLASQRVWLSYRTGQFFVALPAPH
jgi:predicted aspartyl protease